MQKNNRIEFSDSDFLKRKLPQGHREEFLKKLRKSREQQPNRKNHYWKIAAMLIVLVGLGFILVQNTTETDEFPETDVIALELQQLEKQYLKDISTEWENFLKLAKDQRLIARYKEEFSQLDADYKEISVEYQADKNNIRAVEDLIRNLQTRLSLLKDIQEHIKILNQKNEQHKTSI